MKNSILVFLIVSSLCLACSKNRETASGQKFTIVRAGDGHTIDSGKYMILNFMFKDGKDSVWNDTRKNGYPIVMQKQGIVRPGDKVLEVIGMLTKGDSATFKVPAKDIFTKSFRQPLPPKVDSASFFTFVIGMKDAMDSAAFAKFRTELIAKQNEKALEKQHEQLAKDTVIIDNYLKEKNIKASKTSEGLRYVITKAGKGENAKDGQATKVNYAGYLLNGKYFDTSIESVAKEKNLFQQGRPYAPYDVVVGRSQVIPGWHSSLRLMNKGCKMTVYIPSTLAYGSQKRSADIVENSILAFDLELVDVK
jgi:FKBP-type peptidyl-prolyl cis-trans isomerase FkpA